jgi:exopolysaccharide biosynthesis polyprenyl glycosylphosphotransferase
MGMDVLTSIVILAIAVELRPYLPGRLLEPDAVLPSPVIYVVQGLLWHVVFALTAAYQPDRLTHVSKNLGSFTSVYMVGVAVFAGLLFFSYRETSRLLVLYYASANYIAMIGLRYLTAAHIVSRQKSGRAVPVLIVGTLDNALRVAQDIEEDKTSLLKVVGFCDTRPPLHAQLPKPFLGLVDRVDEIVRDHAIEMVIIARSDVVSQEVAPLDLQKIIRQLDEIPVRIYVAPDLYSLALVESDIQRFGKIVLIGLREPVIKGPARVRKRVLDIFVCLTVLILGWPLFVIIWLMVKIDSQGPGIIAVRRVGENGKVFRMYKFRSMVNGAEFLQDKVVQQDKKGEKIYKLKDDPRVTRVGKWLRKYSLDELPQVFNVLKGEMSVVGPRPEQPFITELYDHWQWQRVSVPPGVTGWWQISGRADLPMHLNTEYDVYYVRNYSILLDLKILAKTIIAVIKAKGAY